jgi:hypothetical protein
MKNRGGSFWFINWSKEPYEWTNTDPKNDPVFQGLLEEEASFPDVSMEIPRVVLEEEEDDGQVVMDKPKVPFEALAAVALENAGINMVDHIHAARAAGDDGDRARAPAMPQEPCLVEVYNDKIGYNVTINLPDAGLILPDDYFNALPIKSAGDKPEAIPACVLSPQAKCRYPTRSFRSVVGNLPYNTYAPRMQFLQLGEVRAHRSALAALEEGKKDQWEGREQLHATMGVVDVDDTEHTIDKELTTMEDHEIAVWG